MHIVFTTYNAWWNFKPKSEVRQIYDAYKAGIRYDAMMRMKKAQQDRFQDRLELEMEKLRIQADHDRNMYYAHHSSSSK